MRPCTFLDVDNCGDVDMRRGHMCSSPPDGGLVWTSPRSRGLSGPSEGPDAEPGRIHHALPGQTFLLVRSLVRRSLVAGDGLCHLVAPLVEPAGRGRPAARRHAASRHRRPDGLGPQKAEQRADPRRERPRRDSQGHHQERLSHRSRGPGRSTPGRRRPIASRARPTRCSSSHC